MGFLDIAKKYAKILQLVPGCTVERGGKEVVKYSSAHLIFSIMCRLKGYEIKVNGAEHLIEPGWIWARHTSEKDIPDISYVLRSETGEMPKFVARSDLVSTPFEREQYLEWGAMFLDRQTSNNGVQIRQMRHVIGEAAAGNYVVIFPEGTRNPDAMGDFNPGAAWMAQRLAAKGKNLPIYCMGVCRNGKNMVELNIAHPFHASDFNSKPKKEQIDALTVGARRLVGALSSSSGPEIASMTAKDTLEVMVTGTRLVSSGVSALSEPGYASGYSEG